MHCRCSSEREGQGMKESKEAKEKKQKKKQRKTKIAPFVNARRTAIWLTMRGWAIVMAIDTGVC